MNIEQFVEGYNAKIDGRDPGYRRRSSKDQGFEAARRTILRSQLEHNIVPVLSPISKKDFQFIIETEKENIAWFDKQARIAGYR